MNELDKKIEILIKEVQDDKDISDKDRENYIKELVLCEDRKSFNYIRNRIMAKKNKPEKYRELVRCDKCGYCNQPEMVKSSGVCNGCGKILNEKAKYRYEMYHRLRMWRKK